MPSAGTVTTPPQQGTSQPTQQAPQVPFAQASHHGCEQAAVFTAVQPGAAQQTLGPTPLPATGYLRRVCIEVSNNTAGVGDTFNGDGPFNLFALIRLTDTNGAPIFELSGYNTCLADTYGGFAGASDPRVLPDYSMGGGNTATFNIYVPLELDPTGMGSPANLSASSAYRLTLIVDTTANIYQVTGTAQKFNITIWNEYWTLPNQTDGQGRQQAIAPPYAGTIQLWSQQPNVSVAAGTQRTPLNRMGNLLRSVLGVYRSSSLVRSDGVVGDPLTLRWDDINLDVASRQLIRTRMREYVNDLTSRDVGVYMFGLYNYGLGRLVGDRSVVSWLPTVSATRYEVNNSAGAGGTMDWIINDVSVAATAPQSRAVAGGAGVQFHPPVAPVVPGAV